VDKTPRLVLETIGRKSKQGFFKGTNAYYGNLELQAKINDSWLGRIFDAMEVVIANESDFPDVVNVSYIMPYSSPDRYEFYYLISVESGGHSFLQLRGEFGSAAVPRRKLSEPYPLGEYVKNASHINDALKRDLAEASKCD